MRLEMKSKIFDEMKTIYPHKFVSEQEIFSHIHRGDRIFISTGCGEPQYLVQALINFVESNPKAFFDAAELASSGATNFGGEYGPRL